MKLELELDAKTLEFLGNLAAYLGMTAEDAAKFAIVEYYLEITQEDSMIEFVPDFDVNDSGDEDDGDDVLS